MTQVIVGEVEAGAAAKARASLEQLISVVNKSDFDIGDILYKVKKMMYYEGFNTFAEYVETLKIKPSKARYLTQIAEVTFELDIKREVYEPVGKSKLRHICSLDYKGDWTNPLTGIVTPMAEFIKALIVNGTDLSLDDIMSKVKTLKGQTGENSRECMHIWVTSADKNNVILPAFEDVRKETGSAGKDEEGMSKDYSDGQVLTFMCADRLSGSQAGVNNEKD
jgi:hypothetical protein